MARALLSIILLVVLFGGCATFDPAWMQWEYTGGPVAQDIVSVLPDQRVQGTVYAGLANGQVFISTNDGAAWTLLATVAPQVPIERLIQDPEVPEKIYAATPSGGYMTNNRGRNWTQLVIDSAGTGLLSFAVDPWTPAHIYAGTRGKGIYKSTDGGSTWNTISGPAEAHLTTADVYDIAVDPGKPDHVYAAVSDLGIIRSTNKGATWESLTAEFTSTGSRTTHILIRKGSTGEMLYATDAGSIVKTVNGGQSWFPSRNGLEFDNVLSLFTHPLNPAVVFAGTARGMMVSPDFGGTWNSIRGDLPQVGTLLAAGPPVSPFRLYAYGSGVGVQASVDQGLTWRRADAMLGGSTIRVMATDPSGDKVFVGVGSTCLTADPSAPGGWAHAGTGLLGSRLNWLVGDPDQAGVMYAATSAGIFQTTNDGGMWERAIRGLRVSPLLFEMHPSIKTRMFAVAEQGLFISTDHGKSWSQTRPLSARWHVTHMTFSPKNAGIILAATSNSGVIISRNGGFEWELARYGLPPDVIVAVTLDEKDQNVFYAYTARGECFRTINKGIEWNRFTSPWTTSDSVRIAYDRLQPNSIIALVNNRDLYYSPSGGGTWFPVIEQEIDAEVVALSWNARASCAYAGTRDRGVYRVRIGERVKEVLNQ
jgi:photosystem II stability/assembly factor-like uncharacterized protein